MTILAATVMAKNPAEAKRKILQAEKFKINAVDLRLDCFSRISIEELRLLTKEISLPMIFSLRTVERGGNYTGSKNERFALIKELISLSPDYFDLEHGFPREIAFGLLSSNPKVKLICSYHDLNGTPHDLNVLLTSIREQYDNVFTIYRFVTIANSFLDTLRMMKFIIENKGQVSGNCEGRLGYTINISSRILNNSLNCVLCEAEEVSSDCSQLTLVELFNIYNYSTTSEKTRIFARLGSNSQYSSGHIFHNKQNRINGNDAVYVKIELQASELQSFLAMIPMLPFSGFSVTMPLKEKILPFMHALSDDTRKIGAVNTVSICNEKLCGFNTDGIGALDAIEQKMSVAGKKVVILGYGGAARAIAFEAMKRKAIVTILGDSDERVKKVASQLGCSGYEFKRINSIYNDGYDLLINATPVGMNNTKEALPIPTEKILPDSIVMDVINRPETPLIKAALEINNERICIGGDQMYVNQALAQRRIWSNSS